MKKRPGYHGALFFAMPKRDACTALYLISFKCLYTVGIDSPHTRANSLMFILPAVFVG